MRHEAKIIGASVDNSVSFVHHTTNNYEYYSSSSSSSSFTGFHNPFAGFSLLILEVSTSHTRTHHSR